MRVLFDAYWWHSGPISNRAVMREIIAAWQRCFPADELILAVRARHRQMVEESDAVELVQTHLAPQAFANFFELGVIAKRRKVDLIVAHNFAPLFGRSIVFVHDLMFEDHPGWFTRKENAYFRLMGLMARFATFVVTSSVTESIRITRLHPELRRVSSVGLAPPRPLLASRAVKPEQLGDQSHFLLTVGRLNERKNLKVIVQAALQSATVTPEHPLLVVGSSEFSGVAATLPLSIQEGVSLGRVIFLGKISDGELRWLYERARALVFLSRDEGFGLPVSEAQLFGCPVIASDIAVMREVAGPSATFVGVDDANGLELAMREQVPRSSFRTPDPTELENTWDEIVRRIRATTVASGGTYA